MDNDDSCGELSDGYKVEAAFLEEPRAPYEFVRDLPVVRNFKDLLAWQRSMDLVKTVFAATRKWPREDQGGLANQLRRAAVSVPSNIAEGQGRTTAAEFANRVRIAHGSLREVETQLLIAQRIGLGESADLESALALVHNTGQLVQGLLRSLGAKKH